MAAYFFTSEVISNQKLNDKFYFLKFRLQDYKKFEFQSGQFVVIKLASNLYRNYSIASRPTKLPYWQLLHDVTPNGPGSRFLKSLKPGQKIYHSSTRGIFTLQSNSVTNHILAATGAGLASIIPILEELLQKTNHNVYLFWGLRYQKDLCFLDWLKSLENNPCFRYQIILSQPDSSWTGKRGHLVSPLVRLVQNLPQDDLDIYLCGNQGMISGVNDALTKIKFAGDKINFERYY